MNDGMAWARALTDAQRRGLVEVLTGETAASLRVDAQLEDAVRPRSGLGSDTPLRPLERAGRRRAMLGGWRPGSRPTSDVPFDELVASACAGRPAALTRARRGAALPIEQAADPVELLRQATWVNARMIIEAGAPAFELVGGRLVSASAPPAAPTEGAAGTARVPVRPRRSKRSKPQGGDLVAQLRPLTALGGLRGGRVTDVRDGRQVAGFIWRLGDPGAASLPRRGSLQRRLWRAAATIRFPRGVERAVVVELHTADGAYRINATDGASARRWSWRCTITPTRALQRVRGWLYGVEADGEPPPLDEERLAAELTGAPATGGAGAGRALWAAVASAAGWGPTCLALPAPTPRRRRRQPVAVCPPVIALPCPAAFGVTPPAAYEVLGWSPAHGRWVVEVGGDMLADHTVWPRAGRWRGVAVETAGTHRDLPDLGDRALLVTARGRSTIGSIVPASRIEARRPTYDLAARRVPVTPSPLADDLPRQRLAAELAALPGVVTVDEGGVIRWRVSPGRVVQVGGRAGELDDIIPQPRSLVKWPGGKAWARNELVERFGPIDAYGEGCMGGGATLLALLGAGRSHEVFGVDTNPELIEALCTAAQWPDAVWATLRERWPTDAETFERRKAQLPADIDPIRRAADFFGHNRTAFNGVVRYGALGASNVSRNPGARLGIDRASFMRIAGLLRRARIECDDFCAVTSWAAARVSAGRRVGVLIDCPYEEADGSSAFAAYCGPFGDADQDRVVEAGAYAARAGARVVLTNAWSARAVERARTARLRVGAVFAPRRVNCDGGGRGRVPELIAWSGPSRFGATLVLDERVDTAAEIIDAATRAQVLTMGQRRRCLDRLGGGDVAIRAAWLAVLARRAARRGAGGRPSSISVADVARARLDGGGTWTDAELGAALGASRPAAQRFRARLDEITEAAAAEAGVPITEAARVGWPLLAEGA